MCTVVLFVIAKWRKLARRAEWTIMAPNHLRSKVWKHLGFNTTGEQILDKGKSVKMQLSRCNDNKSELPVSLSLKWGSGGTVNEHSNVSCTISLVWDSCSTLNWRHTNQTMRKENVHICVFSARHLCVLQKRQRRERSHSATVLCFNTQTWSPCGKVW